MKHLSLLFFVVMLQACHDAVVKRTYILDNGTTREIKIDFYQNGTRSNTPPAHVEGKGEIITRSIDDLGMGRPIFPGGAFQADSVRITFDTDKKIQIYYRGFHPLDTKSDPETNRNIFIDSVYTIISNELYRFTFTEDDYDNAAEIGG